MIHRCTLAGYPNAAQAAAVRNHIKRLYHAETTCALCEACDQYHVAVKIGQKPVYTQWKTIIELIAQGMDRQAIAQELDVSVRVVDHKVQHILNHFYALNRAHLVSIAVSLGIVTPNSFVPQVGERKGKECESTANL